MIHIGFVIFKQCSGTQFCYHNSWLAKTGTNFALVANITTGTTLFSDPVTKQNSLLSLILYFLFHFHTCFLSNYQLKYWRYTWLCWINRVKFWRTQCLWSLLFQREHYSSNQDQYDKGKIHLRGVWRHKPSLYE